MTSRSKVIQVMRRVVKTGTECINVCFDVVMSVIGEIMSPLNQTAAKTPLRPTQKLYAVQPSSRAAR